MFLQKNWASICNAYFLGFKNVLFHQVPHRKCEILHNALGVVSHLRDPTFPRFITTHAAAKFLIVFPSFFQERPYKVSNKNRAIPVNYRTYTTYLVTICCCSARFVANVFLHRVTCLNIKLFILDSWNISASGVKRDFDYGQRIISMFCAAQAKNHHRPPQWRRLASN